MAAGGGFSFGQTTNPGFGATNPGFGGATQPAAGGFSFGATATPSAAPATGGFSFGGQAAAKPAATSSFPFGGSATAAPAGGLSFGGATTPATGGGFSLGGAATAPAPTGGLSFGGATTAPAQGGGLSFGGATTAPAQGGGLSFGGATTAPAQGGGLSFGGASTTPASGGGFSLGGATTAPASGGGFSLGGATTAPASGGGFSLGGATTAPAAGGGFSFGGGSTLGGGSTPASRGGLMFGTTATTATSATATPAFSFGSTPTSSTLSTSASTFGASSTQTSTTGLLGFKPQSSVAPTTNTGLSSNLSFGQPTSSAPSFGGLGGAPTTTSSSFGGGFSFAKTTATTGTTLGGSTGFGLGGTNFLSSQATTSVTGSIPSTQVVSKGLGGVDPKVSAGITDGTGQNGKQINSKALKESQLPNQLGMCVEPLKKYIKHEKTIRENISRMTSKSMMKIQVEMAALRQILGTVSNGVQRNAVAVEKLKNETVQELKNTEMGQRTEEISAVLQDENTAPTEYFQHLFEDFEVQMKAYKVEIQNLESHIMSLHQPSRLTPEELTMLLRKSHDNFLALAALFHQVHESVKTLKEKYLNYRRIFLGDTKDIFELKKKASSQTGIPAYESQQGPNPFSGFPSTTAIALAAALSRNQQAPTAPPAMGLGSNLGQPTGFGSTFGNQSSLFANTGTSSLFGNTNTNPGLTGFGTNPSQASTSGFSFGSNTAAVKPLGSLLGSSGGMFGGGVNTAAVPNTATQLPGMNQAAARPLDAGGGFAFGTPQQQPLLQPPLQPGNASLSPTGSSAQFGVQNRPFQLQKPPPPASKRGKR